MSRSSVEVNQLGGGEFCELNPSLIFPGNQFDCLLFCFWCVGVSVSVCVHDLKLGLVDIW